MQTSRRQNSGCSNIGIRLAVAGVIAVFAIISFLGSREYNPVVDRDQYVAITHEQEIALGQESAPQMIQEYGGLYPDERAQAYVDNVGFTLVQESVAADTPWEWDFHVLNSEVINAFALPGGQVFISYGLLERLETEGQLAGVLGHEIVHVLARHSAERIAEGQLTQGLLEAVVVASEGDGTQVAALIAQLGNMRFGRSDELESDRIGIEVMVDAGYDPRGMVGVMEILAEASEGQAPPEFFSTHPNPDNRIQQIQEKIDEEFPNGVPEGLIR